MLFIFFNGDPGVDFINIFTPSFYARRFQKRKKLLNLTVFFALLGSEHVKAACKILVKSTQMGCTHTHTHKHTNEQTNQSYKRNVCIVKVLFYFEKLLIKYVSKQNKVSRARKVGDT